MKKLIIILSLFCGIISCNENESVEQNENQTEEIELIEEIECAYNENNSVSDSLIQMYDEILDKKGDYNQAKYDINIENWQGKSFYIENVTVRSINLEDQYSNNHIVMHYGEKFTHLFLPVTISLFIDMETKEQLSNYEIDEIVDLKGVIGNGSTRKTGYYLHLECGEIIKLE